MGRKFVTFEESRFKWLKEKVSSISMNWSWFKDVSRFTLYCNLSFIDEDSISMGIALPFLFSFSIIFNFYNRKVLGKRWEEDRKEDRSYVNNFSVSSEYLSLELWRRTHWDGNKVTGFSKNIHFLEMIRGEGKYTLLDQTVTEIPLTIVDKEGNSRLVTFDVKKIEAEIRFPRWKSKDVSEYVVTADYFLWKNDDYLYFGDSNTNFFPIKFNNAFMDLKHILKEHDLEKPFKLTRINGEPL